MVASLFFSCDNAAIGRLLICILPDLKDHTDLNTDEIEAYLGYYRKLMGGSIEHQPTGAVVAAVLAMYEADEEKSRLQWIMESESPELER